LKRSEQAFHPLQTCVAFANYAALDVEKLGNVYEGLLDIEELGNVCQMFLNVDQAVSVSERKQMKFLIDAQLPKRLAVWLNSAGYDAVHTTKLPRKNLTTDLEINSISMEEQRIVISKDSDFLDSFRLKREPYKLLQVATGNIPNSELEAIFAEYISGIVTLFEQHDVVKLSRDAITVHQ
jgi:predicted nuclease of predicted toxin-antitoxin system